MAGEDERDARSGPDVNADWEKALEAHGELTHAVLSNPHFMGEVVPNWLHARFSKYGPNATSPSAHAFKALPGHIAQVEPIYVTQEMQHLTYTAMESFNPTEEAHPDDLFITAGLALLDEQFLAVDSAGLKTGWRCITWRHVDDAYDAGEPGVEVILWSHLDDTDEWDEHEDYMLQAETYKSWMRERGLRWSVAHATLIPYSYFNNLDHMGNDGDPKATWLEFLRVLNKLLGEKIALKSHRKPHRAIRRAAQRAGVKNPSEVLVVELRRPKERAQPDWPAPVGREYSHQWIVHGGWQWRACGPGHSRRRQVWIGDYVKGPKDKPLVVKKRVWVWDR